MHTDFNILYRGYTTVELLKIILKPENYQEEAVRAAEAILQTRNVSDVERNEVEQYYAAIALKKSLKKEKINAYKAQAADFLEPVINPTDKVSPKKWLNILLLFIGIQYAWIFYQSIKSFMYDLNCRYCRFDSFTIINYLPLVYVPITFFLLLKRKKWGWILLFFDMVFTIILALFSLPYLFTAHLFFKPNPTPEIMSIIIRSFFAVFLWKESIATHFGIDKKLKLNTFAISAVIAIFFMFILYVITH